MEGIHGKGRTGHGSREKRRSREDIRSKLGNLEVKGYGRMTIKMELIGRGSKEEKKGIQNRNGKVNNRGK